MRELLKCQKCGQEWTITNIRIRVGHIVCKPGEWFVPLPGEDLWIATCGCGRHASESEWGLYHQLGY